MSKINYLQVEEGHMNQGEIERRTFWSLCGERDRKILDGKEKMTFTDFERLMYITDFLGLDHYNIAICNQFSRQFETQFQELPQEVVDWDETEVESEETIREQWIEEFYSQIPEEKLRRAFKIQLDKKRTAL